MAGSAVFLSCHSDVSQALEANERQLQNAGGLQKREFKNGAEGVVEVTRRPGWRLYPGN